MNKKEEWELSSRAFGLMTAQEQFIVLLTFLKNNDGEKDFTYRWSKAVSKIASSINKSKEI